MQEALFTVPGSTIHRWTPIEKLPGQRIRMILQGSRSGFRGPGGQEPSYIKMQGSEHCLDKRTSLREEYRQQHNRCPRCEPLVVLPTLGEVHHCRAVVTAPPGDKGLHARHDTLRTGMPGDFTYRPWVEQSRNAAKAAGLAVDDYVLKVAQVPHRCGRCEQKATLLDESIIRITDELARLRRVHGALYGISFDPLSIFPWRARVLGSRRKLEDDSPARLRRSIGLDKQAAAKRAAAKISLTATLS